MEISTNLLDLRLGKIGHLGPKNTPTGIFKTSVKQSQKIDKNGFIHDQQADLKNHGGQEKAIHHYPQDHYAYWRNIGILPKEEAYAGEMGENLSTLGLLEQDVFIGDIFKLGTTRLQVSQGRQPCWKLNIRLNEKNMARMVQETGRTGWYYRVIEEGEIHPRDMLTLEDRPAPKWSVRDVWHLLYVDRLNFTAIEELVEHPYLAESWVNLMKKRLEKRQVEDWSARLDQ